MSPATLFSRVRNGLPAGGRWIRTIGPGTKEPVFVAEGELRDRARAAKKGCFYAVPMVRIHLPPAAASHVRTRPAVPDAPAPPKLRDRVRGWDLEFESGLLQRGVCCELRSSQARPASRAN